MTPPNDDPESAREARIRRFVEEYVIDHNGVRAYFVAFGRETSTGRPRSYSAACVEASKLLKKPTVRAEIRAAQSDARKRCRVTADRVVNELAAIAFSRISDYFDISSSEPWELLPIQEVPIPARKALKYLKYRSRIVKGVKYKTIVVQCQPKLPALFKLYDHLGMGPENQLEQLFNLLSPALRDQVMAELADCLTRRKSRPVDRTDPPIIIHGDGYPE